MPVYLLHGFRWPRAGFTGIRVHVIVHNLEDTSAEYIQNQSSQTEILQSFRKAYPDIMQELEGPGGRGLTLLEQYDPEDETSDRAVSQPWAFVGDKVVTLAGSVNGSAGSLATKAQDVNVPKSSGSMAGGGKRLSGVLGALAVTGSELSLNLDEVVAEGPGLAPKAWEALADLRDKIAEGEKIGWWVVYNGDPDRAFDYDDAEEEDEVEEEEEAVEEDDHEDGGIAELEEENLESDVTVLPQTEAKRKKPPVLTSHEIPRTTQAQSMEIPLPERSVAREKGKRVAGMKAPTPVEKSLPPQPQPEPPKTKIDAKPEGFKKKFFGRK